MNKKQLAKLLIKHPEIKALYESRAFDTSTINKVIAEEIVRESNSEAETLRGLLQIIADQAKQISQELRDAREEGDEEHVTTLTKELQDLKMHKNEVKAKLDKITAAADKAVKTAEATETHEDDQQVAQALEKTKKALEPAVDAANSQDAEESAKIDAIEQSVDNAATAIKDDLEGIELVDDEDAANASSNAEEIEKIKRDLASYKSQLNSINQAIKDEGSSSNLENEKELYEEEISNLESRLAELTDEEPSETPEDPDETNAASDESGESLLDKVKAGFGSAMDSVDTEEDREAIAQAVIDFAKDPDNLSAASTIASLGSAAASAAGLGGVAAVLNGGSYVAKISEINSLIEQGKPEKAKEEVTGLAISVAIDVIPWGAALKKVPGSDKAIAKVTAEAMKIPAVKKISEEAVKAAVASGGRLSSEALGKVAKTAVKYVASKALNPYSGEESEQATVTLTSNTPKLQQFANAVAQLNPEQEKQLANVIRKELDKAQTEAVGWQDLPQGLQSFDNTLSMFIPTEGGGFSLKPEISNIIPINDENGEAQTFEVSNEELVEEEAEQNVQKIEKEVEEIMSNDKQTKAKALSGVTLLSDEFKRVQKIYQDRINKGQGVRPDDIKNGAVETMKIVLENFEVFDSWDAVARGGYWKKAIQTRKDANQLEDFGEWKKRNLPLMEKRIEKAIKEISDIENEDSMVEDLQGIMGDFALDLGQSMVNSDSNFELSTDDDSDGAQVQGETDLETIKKILPELEGKFPKLFEFKGFVKNLLQALMGDSNDSSNDSDGSNKAEIEDTDANLSQPEINNYESDVSLEESLSGIYLNEEEGEDQVDDKDDAGTGSPISVEDATALRNEFEELKGILDQRNINIDDLLTEPLRKALEMTPEEEPAPEPEQGTDEEVGETPSVEESQQQGEDAAQQDANLPNIEFAEAYREYKEALDGFFSVDSNDGFMDQFLLKYQSKKLWEAIGILTKIESGVLDKAGEDETGEMQAFTKAKEKEEAGVTQEGIADFFKRDKKPEISKEAKTELRTSLTGLLQAIKSLKAMMNSYKDNMTRSSANPKLDGSALKKSLMVYMANLQDNIASIVERCYIEQQRLTQLQTADITLDDENATDNADQSSNSEPQDPQPSEMSEDLYESILEAIAPALDGVYLMEDADRENKIEIVRGQYELMREVYISSLSSALETADRATAMPNAREMLEHAQKEEFISLFPSYVGTYNGKPVSIDDAIKAIQGLVKEFIETMKNVITLAKGQLLEENSLTKVIDDLGMLSQTIENYFGIKSKIPEDLKKKVEKLLAQRKEDQSLSNEARKPGSDILGKAKELGGKFFNKIKSWFQKNAGDVLNYLGDKFLDLFATKVEEAGLDEEEQEEILTAMVEILTWFDSLDNEKKTAVGMFGNNLIRIRGINEVAIPSIKKLGDEIQTDKKKVLEAFMDLSKEHQSLVEDVMRTEREDLVEYLKEILRIKEKLGEEVAQGLISLPELDASRPKMKDPEDFEGEDPFSTDNDDPPASPADKNASEMEMSKIVDSIMKMNNSKTKAIIEKANNMFKKDSKLMLSLMMYYVLYNAKKLKGLSEGPVKPSRVSARPEETKNINKFLNDIVKKSLLSDEIKSFIKTERPKIINFLLSKQMTKITTDWEDDGLFKQLKKMLSTSKKTNMIAEPPTTSTSDQESPDSEDESEYTSSTKTAVAKALKELVDVNSILRDASPEDRKEALIASKYYFMQVATDRRKPNVPSDLSESSSGDDDEKGSNRLLADKDRERYFSKIPDKYAEILKNNEELVEDIEFYVDKAPWNDPDLEDQYSKVDLEESLKPIIEKMLNEHYNY